MSPATFWSRRNCLQWATLPLMGPLSAALITPIAARAAVTQVSHADLLAMNLKSDGVTLEFPRLADTGSAVPLQAEIVAPTGLKIDSIEVYLPENPNTRALKLKLPLAPTRYTFTTRLRLAGTQDVWVVATLSDGTRRGASAPTIITSSACFDGS